MEDDFKKQKKEIEEVSLQRLKEYLELSDDEFGGLSKEQLTFITMRAKLSMQFEKEMNLTKRSVESNFIRVGKMIADDKKELREYLKKTIPNYHII